MRGKPITAAEWNAKYPIGTEVWYWPGTRKGEAPRLGTTRSTAWDVPTGGDAIAVVLVYDEAGVAVPGGIALSHVEPTAGVRLEAWA